METYTLEMENETNKLRLSLSEPTFHDTPDHSVEISYYQHGSEGWGAGGDEYIYDHDIRAIANGIRNLMQYEAGDFVYSCGIVERYCPEYKKPVLVIRLHKHEKTYDFTISMLETLERLSYITVSETGLTAQAFQNYAEIFFMWEAQFCEKGEIYGSLQ